MPARQIIAPFGVPEPIAAGLARLRKDLQIPGAFPAAALAAAATSAAHPCPLPELDRTDIDLVTIDPPGSMDLDQAVHLTRRGDGFTVHYAIADVAAWVSPDDPVDEEAQLRGQTYYSPQQRASLYPPRLSEDAASLLDDGQARPALLWTIDLDRDGLTTSARVERAAVRSRARLTYRKAQAEIDAGTATESLMLLKTVGQLREAQQEARGGISLAIPEQEIDTERGQWRLRYRAGLPVEGWNAQISLLTGAAAAEIMIDGKVGILRTLPAAEPAAIDRLRRTAKGLKIPWPGSMGYPELVRSLDPKVPAHQAMIQACARLFRGAGYLAFDGQVPDRDLQHGALAMRYAHSTAPLRRLVDRYVLETCQALVAGREVPDWVRAALPGLAAIMDESGTRARKYERGIVDLMEALVLEPRIGQAFPAVVVEVGRDGSSGTVVISEPAIEARVEGQVELGASVTVRLIEADPERGEVKFRLV